jgi:two-component system phosphate regulon response regulator PhoB
MKKKILIIEDDKGIVELLSDLMNLFNYDAIFSERIMNIDDILAIKPDLIMLDHLLGDGLGGDLCRKLKSVAASNHIPILMFSASIKAHEIAAECGADDYIDKPFDIDELEQKITALLTK